MKKILIVFFLLFTLTGCTKIEEKNYDDLIMGMIDCQQVAANEHRAGYTYYRPKGLRILDNTGTNEIFAQDNNVYYLYVDLVSYYNKVVVDYVEKKDVVYSKKISNGDYFGYLEIKNTTNNQYFIEIMYNYAKIEVIVPKEIVKDSVAYAMSILTSIKYQDTVLKSLMEESSLKASEVEYNIFETADTESGYLQIIEEYGQYQDENENVDPDFIKR